MSSPCCGGTRPSRCGSSSIAEPVAALYAEGRVAHVGRHDALETQMLAFAGDGLVEGKSPDRVDALVWALTELILDAPPRPGVRML
jgi:phage terminase large subunit-like protein